MLGRRGWIVLALMLIAPVPVVANVITDWDEKAVNFVQPGTAFPPPTAARTIAILHVAMFDAVNSIEPHYKPYKVQNGTPTSALPSFMRKYFVGAAMDVTVGFFSDAVS